MASPATVHTVSSSPQAEPPPHTQSPNYSHVASGTNVVLVKARYSCTMLVLRTEINKSNTQGDVIGRLWAGGLSLFLLYKGESGVTIGLWQRVQRGLNICPQAARGWRYLLC